MIKNQDGDQITLSSFQGKSPVVLFFYPKAGTPGCTAQACSFRDAYERFTKAGAKVRGRSDSRLLVLANAEAAPWMEPQA